MTMDRYVHPRVYNGPSSCRWLGRRAASCCYPLTRDPGSLLSINGGPLGAAEDGEGGEEAVEVRVAALEVTLAGTRRRSRAGRGRRAGGGRGAGGGGVRAGRRGVLSKTRQAPGARRSPSANSGRATITVHAR